MRICIISNGYPTSPNDWWGAFSYAFAQELKRSGHEVFIFTPNRKEAKSLDNNITVKWFNWLGGEKPLVKYKFYKPLDIVKMLSLLFNGKREILKFVQKNKVDCCLALWATPSGDFAYLAKKKLKIPYAVWCLGSDIWIYSKYPIIKNIIKRNLLAANTIFADGLQLSNDVQKITKKHCEFLATSRKLPEPKISDRLVDEKKENFLFVGRLEVVKGIDVLLEAMRLLVIEEQNKNINLYLFGVGSEKEKIIETIKNYKLEKNIHLKGYASAQDVSNYLSVCRCLIIPSRNESIPVVLSDALQMKKPVIVSDVGDMEKLVSDLKIGKVFPSEDSKTLKNAIISMVNEPQNYDLYEHNTFEAMKIFDIKKNADKFIRIAKTYTK